ncbi:MAG TPA: hypothetical protein VLM41_08280 [Steroidobacteraceae bacterium]|nr:hypothetical protein [Steroidobacteraceae bacterium]
MSVSIDPPRLVCGGRTLAVFALGGVLLGGCAGLRESPTGAPAPQLRLISAAELAWPAGCDVRSGEVYRVQFTVGRDGRVGEVVTRGGSGCMERAISDWAMSFRYEPPAYATVATIDWMPVVARRGSE